MTIPIQLSAQWELISDPVGNDHLFLNTYFVNEDTGFVTGAMNGSGGFMRTLDGGISWDTTYIVDITGVEQGAPYALHFPSDSIGYVGCTWKLFKTNNYGDDWFEIDTADVYENTCADLDIHFINNDTGYVGWADCGAGGLRTQDGGLSWSQDPILTGVRHFNEYNTDVTSCAGPWATFNNMMEDWTFYDPINYGWYSFRNSINLNGRIFIIGNRMGGGGTGIFSYTDDLGANWVGLEVGHTLEDITFVNDTVGFMIGGLSGALRTQDGGMTWHYTEATNLSTGMYTTFREISMVNDTVGYAVSTNGIYKTTNGGGPSLGPVTFWPYDLGQLEKEVNLGLYPNPVQDLLTIDSKGHQVETIGIYSLDGKLLQEISGNQQSIKTSDFSSGTYLIEVNTSAGVYRSQFIKE